MLACQRQTSCTHHSTHDLVHRCTVASSAIHWNGRKIYSWTDTQPSSYAYDLHNTSLMISVPDNRCTYNTALLLICFLGCPLWCCLLLWLNDRQLLLLIPLDHDVIVLFHCPHPTSLPSRKIVKGIPVKRYLNSNLLTLVIISHYQSTTLIVALWSQFYRRITQNELHQRQKILPANQLLLYLGSDKQLLYQCFHFLQFV